MAERPEPFPAPDGFVRLARAEGDDWRLEPDKKCRRPNCARPSVAAMNRGYRRAFRSPVDSWWPYCSDHLYGRWIEDGQVMCWVLADAGEDDA